MSDEIQNEQETGELPEGQETGGDQEQQEGRESGQEQQEGGDKPARMVPHSALHEERQRRKEVEERARRTEEEYRRNLEVGNQRLQQLIAASQQRQQPPLDMQPPPSLDQDPVGFVGHLEKTLSQKIQAVEQQQTQILAERQQQTQLAQLSTIAQAHVQAFAQQNPDYFNALQHVRTMRAGQYRALGLSEQQIVAQLSQDEVAFAATAVQNQRNIAESIYEFAKASGYAPKATERKPSEMLAAEARGVAAAKSLGTGGGGSTGTPSLEALATMSDAEFAEATKGDNWRRLMGG